jgi:hypothetical protein
MTGLVSTLREMMRRSQQATMDASIIVESEVISEPLPLNSKEGAIEQPQAISAKSGKDD